jgi:tellurite methyltransferase
MRRAITGYHTDDVGDPVAELSCGHGQHVRHHPPMFSRPWVTTPEGRASMLGTELECVRCDRFELPDGLVARGRTAEFDADTIPAALRETHATKAGEWAVIRVVSGRVRYLVEAPREREFVLDAHAPGVVVPELPHRVEPDGPARLFVELYGLPGAPCERGSADVLPR